MDEYAKWCVGLRSSGLYKEEVIDGNHLKSLLEAHRTETASTFGTRRSSRKSKLQALQATTSTVSASGQSDCDSKENVSVWLHKATVNEIHVLVRELPYNLSTSAGGRYSLFIIHYDDVTACKITFPLVKT